MRFACFPLLLACATLAPASGALARTDGVEAAAASFEALGLAPGPGGYLQTIKKVEQTLVEHRSSARLTGAGGERLLTIGVELRPDLSTPLPKQIDAPMVFIGYGLYAPGAGFDDFSRRDLKDAVLVAVEGAPQGLSVADSLYVREARTAEVLERTGARGLIVISAAPKAAVGTYVSSERSRAFLAHIDPGMAEELFAGSGYSFAEVLEWAKAGRPLAGFRLARSFKARFATHISRTQALAAVAMLAGVGRDDARPGERATVQTASGSTPRPVLIAALANHANGPADQALLTQALGARVLALPISAASRPDFADLVAKLGRDELRALETSDWRPGGIFGPSPRQAQEIDTFQLQMPISLKRIRPPTGRG